MLLEKEGSANDEDITNSLKCNSENDVLQAKVNPPMDLSPIIAKLKSLCNDTVSFADKQITLLWEELTSVQIDQVYEVHKYNLNMSIGLVL